MAKQKHNITEDLKHLRQSAAQLSPDPANARKHSKRNIEAIAASLAKFGQRKPIIVQKDGMVVRAGNGTLEAAKSLGWSHVAAVVLDDDNTTATAFAIADNRTAELAEWDLEGLSSVLHELQDADVDIVGLGWSEDEVDNLLKADWEPPEADGSDGSELKEAAGLAIKFSGEQAEQLRGAIEGEVTADTIVDKVVR